MKRLSIIIAVIFTLLLSNRNLSAAPRSADEAEMIVKGWLKADPRPLGAALGRTVMKVDTFSDDAGGPLYYIVYLEPTGFVIVSADDLVEPVIGFVEQGVYDSSLDNPLGLLVTNDLKGRTTIARSTFDSMSTDSQSTVTKIQQKWNYLMGLGAASEEGFNLMTLDSISDVCVEPLVKSYWGTLDSCGFPCYNYYIPFHYSCGYGASSMAQIMRYHRYPDEPNDYNPDEADGKRRYLIYVNGVMENSPRFLIGGDGNGGPYKWELMPNLPGCSNSTEQRQAVGSICYDAGIAINTRYYSSGTTISFWSVGEAFSEVFDYSNAIDALNYNSDSFLNIDKDDLVRMVNPNLDAGNPVILAIMSSNVGYQHIVICDGYGYNVSTMYHHLNMGWDFLPIEYRNVWYELPDISDYCEWVDGRYRYWLEYSFNTICGCIYNIFTTETGEIISGHVYDEQGSPVEGVVVTAQNENGAEVCTTITNEKGIYALRGLESNTTFTISADKEGYTFNPIEETTGKSERRTLICGNKWEVNFGDSTGTEVVTVGTQALSWNYPIHTQSHDSRTQVIYLADEIGMGGRIIGIALDVAAAPGRNLENWTIRMKHTGMNLYNADDVSWAVNDWTVVYQKNMSVIEDGWQKFEFNTPFEYNGVDNLLVDFSHNGNDSAGDGLCRVSCPGGPRSVYACSDSVDGDPVLWSEPDSPLMYVSENVPNMRLSIYKIPVEIREQAKLIAVEGQAADYFGRAVSIDGDYAIVGAPGDETKSGCAYIFKREGTTWTQQARLRDFPPERGDYFGRSVSISGDYAIVGADDSAFIYKREGTNWSEHADLRDEACYFEYGFGDSVSICGNYAIVGNTQGGCNDRGNTYTGIVNVFKLENSSWIHEAALVGLDSARQDYFGDAVSISGDYVVATSELNYNPYRQLNGAADVFKRNDANWAHQAKITVSDGTLTDSFGRSISIDGDCFVVGAPSDDDNGVNSGSVYVFERNGNTWSKQTKLIAGEEGDNFGGAVSISGDYIIVGARNDDDIGRNSGTVFVFELKDSEWKQLKLLVAGDGKYDDLFGVSVSIDGDYIIIGAEGDDDNGSNSGSAYIFKIE